MNPYEIRLEALKLAQGVLPSNVTPAEVLETAGKFYQFIGGTYQSARITSMAERGKMIAKAVQDGVNAQARAVKESR